MPIPVSSVSMAKESATSWGPSGNTFEQGNYERESRYPPREPVPIPDEPPFTARLLNLDWDISEDKVKELFETPDYKVVSIRVPRDMANGRIRGFAFVEFEDRQSLEKALTLEGTQLLTRTLRVVVADPPQNRQDDRFDGDWRSTRTGPLPPLEGGDRGPRRGPRRDFNDSHDYENWERKGPLSPLEDRGGPRRGGPRRDFSDNGPMDNEPWERRGPLPPLEDQHGSQYSRRQRGSVGGRFGGGAQQHPDDHDYDNWERKGPLPPRRERKPSSPSVEASETSDNWRSSKRQGSTSGGRGDQRIVSTDSTRSSSGSGGPRKKLELKPRTVGAHEPVPSAAPQQARSSLFGAAKPVDTQSKFIEVEEKQKKIDEERRDHHKEESKKDDKVNQVRKRFEVLDTEDHDEESVVANNSNEDVDDVKPIEAPTTVEKLSEKEATAEELESGDWNVVKRSARK